MQRLFLSYNWEDLALMQRLEAALKREDPEAKIFTSLRARGIWLNEATKQLAEATAFVLLVGKKGLVRGAIGPLVVKRGAYGRPIGFCGHEIGHA